MYHTGIIHHRLGQHRLHHQQACSGARTGGRLREWGGEGCLCAHGGRACVSLRKCRRVQSWAVRVKLINRDQRTTKVREVGMALRCCRMHVFDAMPNACVDARLFAIILRMCVHVMHLYHISYVSLSTYPGNEFNIKISHMVASEVATRLSL